MGAFTMNHNYKIPKQPMDDNISIYLPFYDIELISKRTDLPTRKLIKIYQSKVHITGILELDERNSTLVNDGFKNPIVTNILNKFKELKKSNINYGNIGTGVDYEYSGSDYLTVEKFFDYLKSENREEIIKSITK